MATEAIIQKREAESLFRTRLGRDETYIGLFTGYYMPSQWFSLILGPARLLGARLYYVGVTSTGVHFYGCAAIGKMINHDYFSYDEIESLRHVGWDKKKMVFTFTNGRSLAIRPTRNIKAQLRLDPVTESALAGRFPA